MTPPGPSGPVWYFIATQADNTALIEDDTQVDNATQASDTRGVYGTACIAPEAGGKVSSLTYSDPARVNTAKVAYAVTQAGDTRDICNTASVTSGIGDEVTYSDAARGHNLKVVYAVVQAEDMRSSCNASEASSKISSPSYSNATGAVSLLEIRGRPEVDKETGRGPARELQTEVTLLP